MSTTERYTGGGYLERNPDWHAADSPWKCEQLLAVLGDAAGIRTVCEVGCGAGAILRRLHDRRPGIERLVGYEIAPAALEIARSRATERLSFVLADAAADPETFDLMLIVDVIEHVGDPIAFLAALRFKARRTLLHIPLDLSAQAVLRPGKLTAVRRELGHIHYFTPETALATVREAGYAVRGHVLTRPFERPAETIGARLARWPRRLLAPGLTVRLLGGYSLLVDAENGARG